MADEVRVATIGALMRKADKLEDEAKHLKALAHAADRASSHVPEKQRAKVSVAYRATETGYELVTGGGDEA